MTKETKYKTLLNILDKIRDDAPNEYTSYRVNEKDADAVNKARSKAFIHLFLKVHFAVAQFKDRHALLTDGAGDGGLDAYYLDKESKTLYLIQSKFRSNANAFEVKHMTAEDLVKIDVSRILRGEKKDSSGLDYNSKVLKLQEVWRELPDHANYRYKVIFLGNVRNYTDDQIKKLIDYSSYEIFNFEKCYKDLVLPLCGGTFYDPKEISITIKLIDKEPSTLKRKIKTKFGELDVRILFVPAKEIGRIMSKYRNAILKYNPRNYLALSKNKVNQNIRDSLILNQTNEFALYNNGITMLANSFSISETTGHADSGQVIITRPQIINGGQTAYTLSKLYDDNFTKIEEIFGEKEVSLKVVITKDSDSIDTKFIEELSNSTNQQSRVEEADRRSNDKIQITLQEAIFNEFGYFYERKRGEFYYGIDSGFLNNNIIVDRYNLFRSFMALKGQPRWARQRGSEVLFRKDNFNQVFGDSSDYKRMFFSYVILEKLYALKDQTKWGNGLRYGKMAIISAIGYLSNSEEINATNVYDLADKYIKHVSEAWIDFEHTVSSYQYNIQQYSTDNALDFDNYYKGKTIDNDIAHFFSNTK
jgi:hypothetical protein